MHNSAGTLSARNEGVTAARASPPVLAAILVALVVLQFSLRGANFASQSVLTRASSTRANGFSLFRASQLLPSLFSWTAAAAIPVPPVGSSVVSGKITYEGTPPKYKPLDMTNEPTCAKRYTTPPLPEAVVTGPNNSLQNVVVYISAGAPDETTPAKAAATLKQSGCRYTPHVVVMEINQEIRVQNDDSVTHTIHPMAKVNQEWNRSQPPGTPAFVIKYDKPEFIRVKCELHPWMRGVLVVLKNSHYAVSDENGSFSLPDLPPGQYTITAWHETFGEQSQVVTVGGGEKKQSNFVFKAKPY